MQHTLTDNDARVAGDVLAAVSHVAHLQGVVEDSAGLNAEEVVPRLCFFALRNSQHLGDVGKGCAINVKDTCTDFSVSGITVADGDEGEDVRGAGVSAKSPGYGAKKEHMRFGGESHWVGSCCFLSNTLTINV